MAGLAVPAGATLEWMEPKTERQAESGGAGRGNSPRSSPSAPPSTTETGTFPHEHFEAARRAGYTAASVPSEYGGGGYGLDDVALAQIELAKGDGSTALGLAMHLMMCGTEAQARQWPEAARERIFRAVVHEGALLNNAAAERNLGSPQGGGRPETTATPALSDGPGRWRR